MTHASVQKTTPCKTCPWIRPKSRFGDCFDPKALKRTVIADLDDGRIHGCHSNQEFMCAGYLAYAEKNLPQGVETLQLGRIALRLKLLNLELIDTTLDTFDNVKEMLASHGQRAKYASPQKKQ